MAIDSLPEYVSQQKRALYEIVDQVVNLKIEKEDLLEEKKLTMDILMDYEKNRPVAEKTCSDTKGTGRDNKEERYLRK